jgi:hypothetical protein
MATNARNQRLEPAYKQHAAVADKVGVILDVRDDWTNERRRDDRAHVNELEATTGQRFLLISDATELRLVSSKRPAPMRVHTYRNHFPTQPWR